MRPREYTHTHTHTRTHTHTHTHTQHTLSQLEGLHNCTQSLTAPLHTSRDVISYGTQALICRAKVVSPKTSFPPFLSCRQLSHRCLPSPPHVSSLLSPSLMTICSCFHSYFSSFGFASNRWPFVECCRVSVSQKKIHDRLVESGCVLSVSVGKIQC